MKRIRKLGDMLLDVIGIVGCIALFLVFICPDGTFGKLPSWLGIPLAIGGLLFACVYVCYKAYPLLRDIFGARPDQIKKPVDSSVRNK